MYKIRKDYKQVAVVAKKILSEKILREDLSRIIEGLFSELLKKMKESAQTVEDYVRAPDLSEEYAGYILTAI